MSDGPAGEKTRGWRFAAELILVRLRFLAVFVVVGIVAGQWDRIQAHWERWTRKAPEHAAEASAVEYYCPMHPQVVRGEPGSCPICGMPLSRRTKGEAAGLPSGVLARVQLSPWRIAEAGIRTIVVEPRPLVREVSTVGFVEVDERREKRIAARIAGRADGVMVDFTGLEVKEGDPLVALYSPDLVAAEESLAASARALDAAKARGAPPEDLARDGRLLAASRERLLLWGLAPDQVDAAQAGGPPATRVTVRSPLAGTVLGKSVVQGQYVAEGADLYRIADLSSVWIRARVFADDLAIATPGREVEAVVEGLPGETFRGTVAFVDPVVDPATRTAGVRMDIGNPGGRLRPGMYATATIRVPVADLAPFRSLAPPAPREGTAAPSADRGSYFTCTAHPAVVRTEPGTCPECGADLVRRDVPPGRRLQWWCPLHPEVTADHPGEECAECGGMKLVPRLVDEAPAGRVPAVPELSVIDTGSRKVVYRESSPGVFDAVEVALGPRAGEWYPVLSGVAPGDRIAAAGAFLVDAETRLNPAASAAYFGATGSPSGGGSPPGKGK